MLNTCLKFKFLLGLINVKFLQSMFIKTDSTSYMDMYSNGFSMIFLIYQQVFTFNIKSGSRQNEFLVMSHY